MDKGLLFQFMRVKFREAGFAEAEVDLHLQSLMERYQNKTDEEIEADIKRRGGASRIAAATVERRNTVLMADPDYRAFVGSAQAADAEAKTESDRQVSEEPVSNTVIADETEAVFPTESAAAESAEAEPVPAVTEPVGAAAEANAKNTDDDPLAAWFSDGADKTADKHDVPPLFTEQMPQKQASSGMQTSDASDTAQIPAVKTTAKPVEKTPEQQTVHSIPLFGESAQQAASHSAPHAPAPQRAPVPPRAAASDLGRTKVVQVPQNGQTQSPKPAPQQPTASQAYRDEQQAIWSSSNGVRDGRGAQPNRNGTSGRDATKAIPVHNRDRVPQQKEAKPKIEYADRGNVTWLQEKTYWGEGSEEGVKRFRIILAAAALPVAALLLAYAVIALGLIVLMPVLMAAFVIGLVVWVAAGSLVALVAVIYGISQLFIVVPIGMFELGLGIAAIGLTMFVGILMYNIAVRLLPFLLRQFIRFQSIFKGFLLDLYYYVKGECYRR